MIQRIQTLFLLAIAVVSGLMLTGDLITMDAGAGTLFNISFTGLDDSAGKLVQRLWPLSFIIALVPLLALAAIFLYKKRTLQMRVTMFILLLLLGTIILGAFYVIMFERKIEVTMIWRVRALFPLVSAILAWLAYRAIMKDDLKVKSYDRLR
jgi:glucan phosphoethanolaminetransferase (alkaline phosphatase superfamily)